MMKPPLPAGSKSSREFEMSSLIRRLQIRILKRKGYVRQTQKVLMDPITLNPRLVPCKRVMTDEGVSLLFWPRPA